MRDSQTVPEIGSRALEILRTVFGYQAFRGQQQDIITHIASGRDALVLMPTGGGKSLCYQIPAMIRHGVGVVVSPLIALMQDQVDALETAGVGVKPLFSCTITSTPFAASTSRTEINAGSDRA